MSGSGKSTLLAEIIKRREETISPPPERILYFAKFKASVPPSILGDVEFFSGLPTADQVENEENIRLLLILDDLQNESVASPVVVGAFQSARHTNCSLILIQQNLFPRGARARDVSSLRTRSLSRLFNMRVFYRFRYRSTVRI